jgi:hypothetical protein
MGLPLYLKICTKITIKMIQLNKLKNWWRLKKKFEYIVKFNFDVFHYHAVLLMTLKLKIYV